MSEITCPDWCQEHVREDLDFPEAWHCHRRTVEIGRYSVQLAQVIDIGGDEPITGPVELTLGLDHDLTYEQAEQMAAALLDAVATAKATRPSVWASK